ncbi:CmcJ/NvfI family oxidoreductase [uncultured Tateyamaria sp.]|uniref:CmcJ/NvfI family oxidoreductase n=1 Tax=uncultured Tateyamaria sp. TaxID=455651 RepID=UPI002611F95D|nr:CmcJ/NvfI family oxidoreductase [uncultured Tateyamaria sp.]
MPCTAIVNYHIHSDQRQAYHIDAGGVVGQIISPPYAVTEIAVLDVRSETDVNFSNDSVGFFKAPSQVKGLEQDNKWQGAYDQELSTLLKREIGAKEVVVFDHTVRIDDPNSTRKPARNVHSDYSREGAEQRLITVLGDEKAASWANGHYAFINIWRPIENPINSAPLGFVRPSSVADHDWMLIDLIYPDRKGHIMGLAANPDHEWVYQSRMTPDEVALFNIYDNQGKPSVAHSALDLIEDPALTIPRKSIESRTLVRY